MTIEGTFQRFKKMDSCVIQGGLDCLICTKVIYVMRSHLWPPQAVLRVINRKLFAYLPISVASGPMTVCSVKA